MKDHCLVHRYYSIGCFECFQVREYHNKRLHTAKWPADVSIDDMALLIRRLCRVVAKHDAHNTVRKQALAYLDRKSFAGKVTK